MRIPFIIAIVSACLVAPASSRADETARAASTDVVVAGGGGQYEVRLHPSLITSLHFSNEVERVLASNQEDFTIRQMGNAVAIRPNRADTAATGNVIITTESLRITVILKVVDAAADAHAGITFKVAEAEEELERRIQLEVERRLTAERTRLAERVQQGIAEQIFAGFEARRLRAIERNGANVIVKVPEVIRVGDDAYLRFTIQNRSGSTYRLTDVTVTAGDDDRAGLVVFDGRRVPGPMLGQVPAGQSADAIVVVRDAGTIRGPVALEISESGGARAVRVKGIELQ